MKETVNKETSKQRIIGVVFSLKKCSYDEESIYYETFSFIDE